MNGPLLALALMLASASAVAAPAAEPAARVRALTERYRSHLLSHRPDLAMRWGLDGARPAIAPLTEATLERDARMLEGLAQDIAAVPVAQLDAESASLHRMLAGRVEDEADQIRALRHDAFAWVRLLRDAVEHALSAGKRLPCDQAHVAAPLLRSAPELWRGALVVLRAPAPTPALAESLVAARQWLREALPPRVLDCRDALRLGAFVQADSQAVMALESLATFALGDSAFATPRVPHGRSPRGAAGR